MASNRINRINEEIQKELSSLIRTLKDPRIQDIPLILETPDESLWKEEIKTLLSFAAEA